MGQVYNKDKAKSKSGLLTISYIIMIKRSDGKREEITTLNTLSLWGGVAHLTHTKGKHLGYNYAGAHFLNINDIQSQTTK